MPLVLPVVIVITAGLVKDQRWMALPTRTITGRQGGVISSGVAVGEAGLVAFLEESVSAEVNE